MSEIRDGEFVRNDTNEKSMGGTELLTMKLAELLNEDLKKEVQIVSSRVRDLQEDKIRIFWAHDLPGDPESEFMKDRHAIEQFHKYVFVSNWQMQQYLQAYPELQWSECGVLKNAIDPFEEHEKPDAKEQINLIYHSTPHRGLNILVPVWEQLAEKHPTAHLHIYSSFDLYGWSERNEPYQELFDRIDAHPQMTNHGSQPNEVIREALKEMHIFAYPSIWAETSCLCLMEAMSAGLVCVHSNFAALYETGASWTNMYQMNEDGNRHAGTFFNVLDTVLNNYVEENVQSRLAPMSSYANVFYGWQNRINEWNALCTSLTMQIKDRSFPKPKFSLDTTNRTAV